MSAITEVPPRAIDGALVVGRRREDVVVGDEIVRHRLASRVMHWSVALTFFVALVTGLAIWIPFFRFLGALVGGLAVCRWLHQWAGLAFVVGSVFQFVMWIMFASGRDRRRLTCMPCASPPATQPSIGHSAAAADARSSSIELG